MAGERYSVVSIPVLVKDDPSQEDLSDVKAAFDDGYELLAITPVLGYKGVTRSLRYFMRKDVRPLQGYINTGPR